MVDTLGLWLGPTVGVILAALGARWLGWFQPKSRRRSSLRRIAERLAYQDSQGYDHLYERYLEHYLGGRDWHEGLDKAWTQDGRNGPVDTRGPAPKWWQRRGQG